jgi:TonB family protein
MQILKILVAALIFSIVVVAQQPMSAAAPSDVLLPQARSISVAVLDFGDSSLAREAADALAANLRQETSLAVVDRDQARAAAHGAGYMGALNLSLNDARDLGAALGCEFYVLGDAQTLRRSPSTGELYFDSYTSLFLVSARTGKLLYWERPNFRSSTAPEGEKLILSELNSSARLRSKLSVAMHRAHDDEQAERQIKPTDQPVALIEQAPDDDKIAEAEGLRLPHPFRRFTPPYPKSAAIAEAEATVDVLVDLDARGEVTRVEVVRWAGFGLDEATVDTVRQLHFFPAMRNGVAIPLRVLLRYNFRKPAR